MIDLPLLLCAICGLFYGSVWVLNKDLIWEAQMPEHYFGTDFEWRTSQSPKGLWYTPLILAFLLPHNHERVSWSPMSDFLWPRILVTLATLAIGFYLAKKFRNQASR